MDCLIISYSEPKRSRERHQFFNETTKTGSGWGRFLHLNYIDFQNDILLPNHLASIADLTREKGGVEKTDQGLFRESDISKYSAWKIPLLGGLFLYQYLRGLSFDVGIVQHAQLEKAHFDEMLGQGPKVIAISTTLILNPVDIFELVRYCRSRSPESFIVLGGLSIWNTSLSNNDPPNLFKTYRADGVVLDPKGFKTLGVLVDHIKNRKALTNIPNLILYSKAGTEVTAKQPEDYDFKRDAMKWDLIDDHLLGRISLLRTAISCPFNCSFCSYPVSQGPFLKSDLPSVEAELNALENRGVKYLLFTDDTFNFPKKRFAQLLSILKNHDFSWYAFIRCQYLDQQVLKDMKESGCKGAYLGIESANDRMLKAMNKRSTTDDYKKGVELLASQGITTLASFVVGFPGETEGSIQDTKRFIETSGIDYYNVKIFYYEHCAPIRASRSEFQLTGQGMNWTHNTMTSAQAFTKAEDFIRDIGKVPYIPQHSGEIWEIAYFQEKGFSLDAIHLLYKNFTKMLQDAFTDSPDRLDNQTRLFNELIESFTQGRNE